MENYGTLYLHQHYVTNFNIQELHRSEKTGL